MKFVSIKKFYLLFLSILISCSSDKDVYESPQVTNIVEENNIIEQNISQEVVSVQDNTLNSNSTESFTFIPIGSLSNKPLSIFYHIPDGDIKNLPILFSFHGASRNASSYRNYWIEMANENNFMVFAPEFDDINYEGGDKYNRYIISYSNYFFQTIVISIFCVITGMRKTHVSIVNSSF